MENNQVGTSAKNKAGRWVQTERKAHEAWARLIARKPRAAMLLHHLVAQMGHKNAVVISQKTLSKLMGVSLRTTQSAVADLVEEKWIQIVKLNGPGTVAAYVINDQVAWGQPRDQLRLSVFSATVVADAEDQDPEVIAHWDLMRIPTIFTGEQQMPSGQGEDPPSQTIMDGFEPELPARNTSAPEPNTRDLKTVDWVEEVEQV